MSRLFSKRQRTLLAMVAGGKCEICGVKLTQGFHADHVQPWSKNGPTNTTNGAALCPTCNQRKGNKMKPQLREWQNVAIEKAKRVYSQGKKHFVVDAAPGAGKTLFAIHLANEMFAADMIDRVIVIAPRNEIVKQWAKDFKKVTKRTMSKITGAESRFLEPEDINDDISATWSGIAGIQDMAQAVCRSSRVFVIADEVHHAALEAAWGKKADGSMNDAKYVLAMSGTPIRSDGQSALWMEVSDEQRHEVTYGETVERGWCVPISFHRHRGEFKVDIEGQSVIVTPEGRSQTEFTEDVEKVLDQTLRFEKLVKIATRDTLGKPRLDSYHSTMIDWAGKKLEEIRAKRDGEFGKSNAGALVIAPTIEMAEYFKDLIEMKWPDESVKIVHSNNPASERIISSFRESDSRWIVSVNMISEGVDIHRLRVLVYLPMASTALYFRQAMGRVIRKQGRPEDDNSRAYVVMPETQDFVQYAQGIEREMDEVLPPEKKQKSCPACGHEGERPKHGKPCTNCGYEPDKQEIDPLEFWTCGDHSEDGCGALNPAKAKKCHACGKPKTSVYGMTLEEAEGWRDGVVVRGDEVNELDVIRGEEISSELYKGAIASGNDRMIGVIGKIPLEIFGALDNLFQQARDAQHKRNYT